MLLAAVIAAVIALLFVGVRHELQSAIWVEDSHTMFRPRPTVRRLTVRPAVRRPRSLAVF